MAFIGSAYSYYLSTYGVRPGIRYGTHKKSELRDIYNRMVKVNKESPLYKIKNDGNIAKFAIDIKENAQNIRQVVASLSGSDDILQSFQKKIAVSSQEDVVSAQYVGSNESNVSIKDFELEVLQLAKPQINIGNFLKSSKRDLSPDGYFFDLNNSFTSYEFQFNVLDTDTNYSIQSKLANLITNANIGLKANVLEDENGMSALRIESGSTGLEENEECLFQIKAGGKNNSVAAIYKLGIDNISQQPQNCEFLLNGTKRSSYANTFTINNAFELTLHGISPNGNAAVVGFKANADTIAENINTLVDSYNSIMQTANNYAANQHQSQKLMYQMGSVAKTYKNELESIGLTPDEDGFISIDKALLTDLIESEKPRERFRVLNDFKTALDEKAASALLNPMEYVDKVIIAYKNPGKNFVTPYITSLYSGMIMDWLC